jgi:ABC-type branched-subunit amino acid transport system substrate-binding protein
MLALLVTGCTVTTSPPVARVALLGPFEGRYREVGYNALYAARLALREMDGPTPDLLPIDDGGSPESAARRAEALALDPLVRVVIVVGYEAAAPTTQAAVGDLPVIVPGNWTTQRAHERVFLLANPALANELTIAPDLNVVEAADAPVPLVGGDVLGLAQFPRLRASLEGVTLLSVGQLADADFAARYQNGDPFAPEPNVLAMLTYDATRLAARAALAASGAAAPRLTSAATLAAVDTTGLSGPIAFTDGVWRDAPRHAFRFGKDGQLVAVEGVVEQR